MEEINTSDIVKISDEDFKTEDITKITKVPDNLPPYQVIKLVLKIPEDPAFGTRVRQFFYSGLNNLGNSLAKNKTAFESPFIVVSNEFLILIYH